MIEAGGLSQKGQAFFLINPEKSVKSCQLRIGNARDGVHEDNIMSLIVLEKRV